MESLRRSCPILESERLATGAILAAVECELCGPTCKPAYTLKDCEKWASILRPSKSPLPAHVGRSDLSFPRSAARCGWIWGRLDLADPVRFLGEKLDDEKTWFKVLSPARSLRNAPGGHSLTPSRLGTVPRLRSAPPLPRSGDRDVGAAWAARRTGRVGKP